MGKTKFDAVSENQANLNWVCPGLLSFIFPPITPVLCSQPSWGWYIISQFSVWRFARVWQVLQKSMASLPYFIEKNGLRGRDYLLLSPASHAEHPVIIITITTITIVPIIAPTPNLQYPGKSGNNVFIFSQALQTTLPGRQNLPSFPQCQLKISESKYLPKVF